MTRLIPSEAGLWPLLRVIGLVLIYLGGLAGFFMRVGLPSETVTYSVPGVLFGLGPVRFVLIAATIWQVYELVRPPHLRPRTMMIYRDANTPRELFAIGTGVLLALALSFAPLGGDIPLVGMIFGLVPILFVVVRGRTIVDGEARSLLSLGIPPKRISFDEIAGLGRVEVRMMRGGTHVGTRYYVGVFLKAGGEPLTLTIANDPVALDALITRIAAETGLPAR